MCGIVGAWHFGEPADVRAVERACLAIRHRGPDDCGVWEDQSNGLVLGHVRLSILDLTPAGHQPMHSSCGRYVLVFNGEIYNHQDLRRRVVDSFLQHPARSEARTWRGRSDTETLLSCFAAWGVEETLKQTIGMFALALWDRQARKLTLARDRFGEKPIYYGFARGAMIFASELKAINALPGFARDVDRGALALFMRHSCVPAPYCIYRGLSKLPPGSWLEIAEDQVHRRSLSTPSIYWSALDVAIDGLQNTLVFGSDEDAADELERVISRSIQGQMIADVPVGAFLSGGVDSSTVVALMQAHANHAVKTFSIGFREEDYDEAHFARAVAQHLGTEHTELYVTPEDALSVIPKLASIFDEPFSDSSQIPTYLIARLTRQKLSVALSGDGGDELFGGYSRYFITERWWKRVNRMPGWFRRHISKAILAISPSSWDRVGRAVQAMIPRRHRYGSVGTKMHKLAGLLTADNEALLYRYFVSHWDAPEQVVLDGVEPPTLITSSNGSFSSIVDRMMALDAVTYLPDDILVKVDRAAMAVSLETRVPLLDHRVFEFAWRLPGSYKVRDGQGKWLLRQVLYRYVPEHLVNRPKTGFAVPIDLWLRGPLLDWCEALIAENRLKREGYFDPKPIRRKWAEHLSGKRNWQYYLWDVLMFQAWLTAQR